MSSSAIISAGHLLSVVSWARLPFVLCGSHRVQKTKVMKTVPEMIPEEDEEPTKPLKEGAGRDSTATQKLPQPSLVRALVRAFWDTFLTAALFKLLGDIMIFVNPQLLQ